MDDSPQVQQERIERSEIIKAKAKGDRFSHKGGVDPIEEGEAIRGMEDEEGNTFEEGYEFKKEYDQKTAQRKSIRKLKNIEVYSDQLVAQSNSADAHLKEEYGKDWANKMQKNIETFNRLRDKKDRTGEEDVELQNAVFDLQNISRSEHYNRLQSAQKGLQEAENSAKELFKEDFSLRDIQSEVDEADRLAGTGGGVANYIGNKLGKISKKTVHGVLSIPRLIDSAINDKETKEDWSWADTWGSALDEYSDEVDKTLANPSKFNRSTFENIAMHDGKEWVLDDKGNVTSVRDETGKDITSDLHQGHLEDFYSSGAEVKKDAFSGWSPFLDKTIDVAADFAIMRGMGVGLAGQSATYGSTLAKVGGFVPAFANIQAQAYKEAFNDLDMDGNDAAQYALTTAVIQAGIETTIGNIETRFSKPAISRAMAKADDVVRASVGKVSATQLATMKFKTFLKDLGAEFSEEMLQGVTDNAIAGAVGMPKEGMDVNDIKETLLLTTAVVGMASGASRKRSELLDDAYVLAAKKPEKYKEVLDQLVESGVIDADVALAEKAKVDEISSVAKKMGADENKKVLGLLSEKHDIENENVIVPNQKERITEIEEAVNSELGEKTPVASEVKEAKVVEQKEEVVEQVEPSMEQKEEVVEQIKTEQTQQDDPIIEPHDTETVTKTRAASQVKSERTGLTDQIKKSFPDSKVIEGGEEFRAAQEATGTDAPAFMHEGNVYIDDSAGDREVAEEFAHIWTELAKHNNSPVYNRVVKDIMASEEYEAMRQDPQYANLTEEQTADEIFAKKVAGEVLKQGKGTKGLLNKIKILPTNLTPSNVTVDKAVKSAAKELVGGRAIGKGDMSRAMEGGALDFDSMSALGKKDTGLKKMLSKTSKFFSTSKGLSLGLRNKIEKSKNRQRAILNGIGIRHEQLKAAIKDESQFKAIGEVFRGERAASDLPEEIQKPLKKLMDLRDRFNRELIDNLEETGKVVINEDLKIFLTNNYDKRSEYEEVDLSEKYNAVRQKAASLQLGSNIQAEYERLVSEKQKYLNFKKLLDLKVLESKLSLAETKGQDVPVRIQKLYNEIRDLHKQMKEGSAGFETDKQQESFRKILNKRIKILGEKIDKVKDGDPTLLEMNLMDQVKDLHTIMEDMVLERPVNKTELMKLVDQVQSIEQSYEAAKMSMNETISIRYKKNGEVYDLEFFQKDGSREKAQGVTAEEASQLMGHDAVDEMNTNLESYIDIGNPKVFYNNLMYESLRKGGYENRSYMMHDIADYEKNIKRYIGEEAYNEAVRFIDDKYSDKRIVSFVKNKRPDGEVEYVFTNAYGVKSKPMKISNPKKFFTSIGMSERQANTAIRKDEHRIRGAKYINHGVEFNLTHQQRNDIISAIVTPTDMHRSTSIKQSDTKVDMTALRRRKNIAPEIRGLMGEFVDPRVNIFRTLVKSSMIAEQTKFNNWFIENGKGVYISDKKTDQHTQEVTKFNVPTMGNDETFWTTPEMYDAVWGQEGLQSDLWKAMTIMSGMTKAMLTVYKNDSQARNFWGAMLNMFASGNITALSHLPQAMKIVSQDFSKAESYGTLMSAPLFAMRMMYRKEFGFKGNEEMLKAYEEMVEFGLIESSADIGEFQDVLDMVDDTLDFTLKQKAKTKLKRLSKVFSKPYQMSDAIFKVAQYIQEKKRYEDAGVDNAATVAAEIVKNTQPTYGRAPEALRRLSRSPLLGNFVLFRAEVYRTRYNILKLAAQEIKSDNPELKKIGAKRLTSFLASSLITPIISGAAFAMLGMGSEEEEAVRQTLPKYQHNNQIIPLSRVVDGEFKFFDMSFIDPSSDFHRAAEAALRGEDITDKAGGFLEEMGSGFLDADIFLKALHEAFILNKDQYKRDIYNEEDDLLPKAGDMFAHVADPLVPGGLKNAWNFAISFTDQEGDIYKLNPADELLNNVMGFKQKTRKLDNAYGYRMGDMMKEYMKRKEFFNQNPTDKNYKKSVKKMEEKFEEMLDLYEAGELLFPEKTDEQLEKRRVYKYMIEDLYYGYIQDYRFKEEAMDKYQSE